MTDDDRLLPRERILLAASRLLAEHGREGVSTRSVSAAAGVQPQTIYRQYGDMQGLLNAVAKAGFAAYLEAKTAGEHPADPVDEFRAGWDGHVGFALQNPALYALMYGDPRPGVESVTADIEAALGAVLRRVALAGRLRVSVERAIPQVLAANVGTALALLSARARGEAAGVDSELSSDTREMVVGRLMDETESRGERQADTQASTAAVSAAALGASLSAVDGLFSAGELTLLGELLARIGTDARR